METKITKSEFQSIPRQTVRLKERHEAQQMEVECCGMKIIVDPGVYGTSGDSELMANSVYIEKSENFLEIGCGTGIISLVLAKRAKEGIGVDINDRAVENSKYNADRYKIANVKFFKSDVFEKVSEKFDVIVCNPPYTNHEASDTIDRMFWDPEDEMKRKFFKEVKKYLKPGGRIYFGWANFADINVDLPLQIAKENGCTLVKTFSKPHSKNEFTFFVFEFV